MEIKMAPLHRRSNSSRRLRGAVLVVGLIFLALLTLMGAAAYTVATQQERMAGNARDRVRAFEAAELALRQCETQALSAAFDSVGTGGFYLRATPGTPSAVDTVLNTPQSQSITGVNTYAVPTTGLTAAALTEFNTWTNPPVCVAEAFDVQSPMLTSAGKPLQTTRMYRIAAVGYGMNQGSRVTLVSTYGR